MATRARYAVVTGPWWSLVLRGIVLVALGIVAIVWPDITVAVLIALFGALVLIDGILASVGAIVNRKSHEQWWLTLLAGLVGIFIGIAVFAWPGVTTLVLLYIIAAWLVMVGIIAMIAAFPLRQEIRHPWLLLLAGIIAFFGGIALFVYPVSGAVAIVWVIGLLAIAYGLTLFVLGFQVRSAVQKLEIPGARA
jgi:uncharacterized membrane protein HdeD (DUF308 family)